MEDTVIENTLEKKKKKITNIFLAMFVFLMLAVILFFIIKFFIRTFGEKNESGFLSSTEEKVQLYQMIEDEYQKSKDASRGTPISIYEKEYYDGAIAYTKIKLQGKTYYVKKGFTTKDKEKIIQEKKVYVRTNTVLYYDSSSTTIISSLPSGTPLEIIGYNIIQKDGSVDMYQVKSGEKEGYVYAKYVLPKEEDALSHYNENGLYDIHKTRGDTFGGSAAHLDYYPYPKANFSSPKMPENVRAFYINASALKRIDDYITLAKKNNINAFVIDIKENTLPAYASSVMSKYSETSYKKAMYTASQYKSYVKNALSAGFYVIGRISTFQDHYYALDHTEESILDTRTGKSFLYQNFYWPSAYSRKVWEYNVELAKDAVRTMGFHEIQFDYIHFPEISSYEQSGALDLRNTYGEDKASAIQQFLMYAKDALHSVNAYISAEVSYDTAGALLTPTGQYFPAISNVVDVISPSLCPDQFPTSAYGLSDVATENPYALLTRWSQDAHARQKEISSPAMIRAWIQGYDATKEPYTSYDANKVENQIKALYDANFTSGYMVWNPNSSLEKYKQIAPAMKKEYKHE